MTKILYIAGSGRSGSTLLSLLLSQHPSVVNLGQIRDLYFSAARDVRCSCGEGLNRCAFWGGLVKSGGSNLGRRLPQLAQEEIVRTYQSALRQARSDWVVDSSKSADLCEILEQTGFDVFAVNLVRDPQAVSASWSKSLARDRLKMRMRNWQSRQKRLQSSRRLRVKLLLYEDLCARPQQALAEVQNWAGIPVDLSMFTGQVTARIDWTSQHLFPPTNAEVLAQRASKITVKTATNWTNPKFADARLIAQRTCFPFAAQYGYQEMAAP